MTRKPSPGAASKAQPKARAKRKGDKPSKATAKAISAESDANRQPNGRFGKGNVANPGGRPKENAELRELARGYTEDAIKRLAYWMLSEDATASVKAASVLLDRGWGKAMQSMEMTGKDGAPIVPVLNVLHTDGRSQSFAAS